MKKPLLLLLLVLFTRNAFACISCNKKIQEAIWDSTFVPNLLTMLSAFFVLGLLVLLLCVLSKKRYSALLSKNLEKKALNPVPLTAASAVAGIGLGGFFDGIVFHQILQWHEMLSNKIPPITYEAKTVNMFWDGVFHAFCLLIVIIAFCLFWKMLWKKGINWSGNIFTGGLLLGWALFNLAEGLIDHHLLKLHNVREITQNPEAWNYGFLGISVVMLLSGYFLISKGSSNSVLQPETNNGQT